MNTLPAKAKTAFARFDASGEASGTAIGSGHINDTYGIRAAGRGFVLQRVNPAVFPYAQTQMENIRRILAHLERVSPDPRSRLSLVETTEGTPYWKDEEGAVWRCYREMEDTQSVDAIESPERAYEAARCFGRFQRLLGDLPEPPLSETIPGFHDAAARLRAFQTSFRNAGEAKRSLAADAIAFARENTGLAEILPADLPLGVCHNDTKVNNVLFESGDCRAVCVVDLDTVMPGRRPVDFGDLARSAASDAPEDCRELERIVARPAILEALASGYLEEAASALSWAEREALVDAPTEIAYELGVRFLTDFLDGDVYFKIRRPGQNLDRARVQFRLAEAFRRERSLLARFCGVS
ncbi:MAG: mucin desulfatase [Elusimicrobia bacterium CG_4_9_14_3_um_filter_62_55]|nr:MAG: mucin desulfatase [Elusimicrobia bacterium CG22_combo_CG10-13_8_21_14_all_63_91]PJA12949.1 MAG: mucin desulfatase [Elusimicrobia bacterium CG_4_10_14_0_2_um_filter_63_34]PJB25802.1 MAG: mucin desulfatase [Elusimicrobia bacterium CG_4_9_14_3_um_filter_62_55]